MKKWELMTISGRTIDLLDFSIEDIDIEDIAHHLSMTNRYGGACARPYNNAQHSVLVSKICELRLVHLPVPTTSIGIADADADKAKTMLLFRALFHDAAEAYVGDMTRPMKEALRRLHFFATGYRRTPFDILHDEIQNIIEDYLEIDAWLINYYRSYVPDCDTMALWLEDAVLRTQMDMTVDKASLNARNLIGHDEMDSFIEGYTELSAGIDRVWPPVGAKNAFLDRFKELHG